MTRLNDRPASIYSRGAWTRGHVVAEGGIVAGIEGLSTAGRPEPPFIVPGFVDLHVHGGGGADVMEGAEAVRATAAFHARHGSAALCATTVTAPVAEVSAALDSIARVERDPGRGEAEVLGAHVEGPFVNAAKLGGQPPFAVPPSAALAADWCGRCSVRIVTLAPELEGCEPVVRFLASRGVRVQVGHSAATADVLDAAWAWGLSGFTHLFNAVEGLSSRAPGVSGWALSRAESAELICDLEHVHPDMLRAAVRCIPEAYCVTDCCAAAGRPDGPYRLGRSRVEKRGGLVCLEGSDKLAASVLTGAQAFKNLIAIGMPPEAAVRMTSVRPAEYLGLGRYGDIRAGKAASLVELDEAYELRSVWIRGSRVEG